jgi:hypothetical protein
MLPVLGEADALAATYFDDMACAQLHATECRIG